MLSDADAAMYRAQTDPDRSFAIFNDTMQKEALKGCAWRPICARSGSQGILSVLPANCFPGHREIEALKPCSVGNAPGSGCLPHIFFIPVMEETGLIVPAGEWVIQEACLQTKIWREKFTRHNNLSVNVNVSAKQLSRPELTPLVRQALPLPSFRPSASTGGHGKRGHRKNRRPPSPFERSEKTGCENQH